MGKSVAKNFGQLDSKLHDRILWILVVQLLFSSCSSTLKEDQISQIPITQTSHFTYFPDEVLHYEVDAGLFKVGNLDIQVSQDTIIQPGKSVAMIQAEAHTRKGIAFVSKNDHLWQAWIDTANGLSIKTYRKVRENKYQGEFLTDYLPDSSKIKLQRLHKEDKPIRGYDCRPDQMTDMVNMIWRFRYMDLSN